MISKFIRKLIQRNKIVVYTAIIGDYDHLIDPRYIDESCDYICFTDNYSLKSDIWRIIYIEQEEPGNTRNARKYKILPHKFLNEYNESVWIDGNFEIVGSIRAYIKEFSNNSPILCINHPQRDCIYYEADACIKLNKDNEDIITEQVNRYKNELYPDNNGMIASGILYRKHNDKELINIMEQWWDELKSNSKRDQLSFNYVCWKYNFNYDSSDICYWGNKYFNRVNHK